MKNETDPNDQNDEIHLAVPIIVVAIVTLLDIVIPYMINSNLKEFYLTGHPIIQFKTIIFIALLLISALGVSTVRYVKDTTIKSLLYLVMGFATFWIVGAAYNSSLIHLMLNQPTGTQYFKLFSTDFIPIVIFAMANAITVLVALVDGRKNGMIFGTMGLGVIIFPVAVEGLDFINSKPDIFLILIVLWALIPASWIKILANTINDISVSLEKRVIRVLIGAVLTLPIYIIIGLLTYFIVSGNGANVEPFSLSLFISKIKTDISLFVLSSGYLYILPHVILVASIFTVYEFTLHAFNLKKEIESDGTVHYTTEVKKPKTVMQKDYDPFEDIIREMKEFKKEFGRGKINRLLAAQKIGTIREQVDFLYAKYDMGSKEQALELLRQIERESEFAFK